MLISDAKAFVGSVVQIAYSDRTGKEVTDIAEVFDVTFVPLYGPCIITDIGDIRLDRIIQVQKSSFARSA